MLVACNEPKPPIEEPAKKEKETDVVYCNLTATDALNRTLPDWEEVGDPREKKQVGIFYRRFRLVAGNEHRYSQKKQ